jgi:hypothetical protein
MVPTLAPPPPPGSALGLQMFEADVSPDVVERTVDSGAGWVRTRLLWSLLERRDRSPPSYDWAYSDSVLVPLVEAGLTPLVTVYGNPTWASSTDCGRVDRVPVERFGAVMGALAERYDGDGDRDAPQRPIVRHWQISNEQDFNPNQAGSETDSGGCFGGRAADFGLHLRAAYQAVKAASSSSVVIFGGVAYERFYNKAGYSPAGPHEYMFTYNTLDSLRSSFGTGGGWPYFDWMALHAYNDYRNNWDGAQPVDQELVGKVAHFRAHQLVRSGVWDARSYPIALTEGSLPSMPSDQFTTRTETLQAVYPGQLMARGLAAGLRAIFWYSSEDHSRGNCANIYDWLTFGLLRSLEMRTEARRCARNPIPDYQVGSDHEPKPSYSAFTTATGQLGAAQFDRQLSTAETGNSVIEAYRIRRPDGRNAVVAWADNGERIGRNGFPPGSAVMRFSGSVLPGWTGNVVVVNHLGGLTRYTNVGPHLDLLITLEPKYVYPD